ncbi:MAG: hypothetical protein IJQ81_03415 [Oscillibacter sp.]|nr:hypothetical protein [Oscillibacter sp.]
MKKLNKYLAYVDNGKQTASMALTATSKKSAMKALDGMGEVVALKNLNDERPVKAEDIREALQASKKFDKLEMDWIVHALTLTGIVTDGTEPQPEAKTDAAPEAKPEKKSKSRKAKTDAKPDVKADAPKLESKPEDKGEKKPDAKPTEEKKSA